MEIIVWVCIIEKRKIDNLYFDVIKKFYKEKELLQATKSLNLTLNLKQSKYLMWGHGNILPKT